MEVRGAPKAAHVDALCRTAEHKQAVCCTSEHKQAGTRLYLEQLTLAAAHSVIYEYATSNNLKPWLIAVPKLR